MKLKTKLPKSAQRGVMPDRAAFWRYCTRAINSSSMRSVKRGIPCTITSHDLDKLFVDQDWRCAVSGIQLETPQGRQGPFTPSLDRIIPALGYVPGNIRIVCNLVNCAMNKWGEEPLRRIAQAMRERT